MMRCRMPSFIAALLWGIFLVSEVSAFAPHRIAAATKIISACNNWQRNEHRRQQLNRPTITSLYDANSEDESTTVERPTNSISDSLFSRFLSPKIDDPGLPLTEVLLAQIVAPTFQIYWLVLNHAPNPTWLTPISSYFGEAPELAPRGSLLAPTLIHGAGLAVCWLAGALAAKMYERDAFTLKDTRVNGSTEDDTASGRSILDVMGRYDTIIWRLIQAGAFASGILIVSTQLDLLLEFKGYVQYGESDETDLRLLVATVEVINDIFWEALVLSSWRIIHANFMSTPDNRLKRW